MDTREKLIAEIDAQMEQTIARMEADNEDPQVIAGAIAYFENKKTAIATSSAYGVSVPEPEPEEQVQTKSDEELESEEETGKTDTQVQQDEILAKIDAAIQEYGYGFWAEENVVGAFNDPDNPILPSGYKVEQAIAGRNAITITNPNNISQTFDLSNLEATSEAVKNFIASGADRDSTEYGRGPEYYNQADEFKDFVNSYIDDYAVDPSFDRSMLNVNDMNYRPGATVADLMQTGDFTIKDLIYKVKDDIGTLDWWNNKQREEYSELTDEDIDALIEEAYGEKIHQLDEQYANDLYASISKSLESEDFVYTNRQGEEIKVQSKSELLKIYRDETISAFQNETEADLATVNMEILHGNLTDEERVDAEERREELITKLNAEGEYTAIFDYTTGQLIRLPNDEDPFIDHKTQEDVTGDLEQIEQDLNAEFNATPGATHLELAEHRFNKNALALIELNRVLDEDFNLKYTVNENGEEVRELSDEDDKEGLTWKTVPGSDEDDRRYKTLRDFIFNSTVSYYDKAFLNREGFILTDMNPSLWGAIEGMTEEETRDYRLTVRDQVRKLRLEQEVLRRMYLLNEDVLSIEKSKSQQALKSMIQGLPFINTDVRADKEIFTEMEVVEDYTNVLTNSGIPVTDDQLDYAERTLGETVVVGGAGTVGILTEFMLANKAAAIATGAKLFGGGKKSLDMILASQRAKKFTNGTKVLSTEQIAAAAAKEGISPTAWRLANGYNKSSRFFTRPGDLISTTVISGLLEGFKFASLPSSSQDRLGSFANGFGFGGTGNILGPLLGNINAQVIRESKTLSPLGKEVIEKIANQSLRINKAYNLAFKAPLSFAIGTEVGENLVAITDDLLGGEEYSTFIDKHYGDLDEVGKRFASNYLIGGMLNLTHKATYKNSKGELGFENTLRDLESTRDQVTDILFTTPRTYLIRNKNTGATFEARSAKNYQGKNFEVLAKPGQRRLNNAKIAENAAKEGITPEEYSQKYFDLLTHLQSTIRRSNDGLDLVDTVLGPEKLKRQTEQQTQFYKDKGVDLRVEIATEGRAVVRNRKNGKLREISTEKLKDLDNTLYEVISEPIAEGRNAEVYYIDKDGNKMDAGLMGKDPKGSTMIVRYNAERYNPGLAAHELGHTGMEILFGSNARFKASFLNNMMDIARDIKTPVTEKGELPIYDNLYEAVINEVKGASRNKWESARIKDWEMFSYISEKLSYPENLRQIESAEGFTKLKELVDNNVSDKTGTKYNLTTKADVVRFFGDYVNTIKRGENSLGVLEHLNEVVSERKTAELREIQKAYEESGLYFSEESRLSSLAGEKKKLIQDNIKLFNDKPEGYEAKMKENLAEIKKINDALIINRAPVNEDDQARKDRVNRIHAGHKDVMFDGAATGRDAQRRGEAIDAIIGSYRGKTIAIAKSQGRFETPTFENMSKSEKENFAWEVTQPELIKHLDAFNRKFRETDGKEGIENDDLDAYINSYLQNKLGTALGKKGVEKTEFTGTTSDIQPSKEPGYVPSEMKLNNRTDARLRIDIRDRLADNAPEGRESQIKQGIKEHGELIRNFVETSSNVPSSYRGLKNIKVPKDLVDKVFGKNTKERIETIGRTLDIAKKSALPEGTLSTRTGNVELEGKAIGVANTLQTINIAKKGQPANYKEVLYGVPERYAEFVSKETGRLTAEADPTGQGNTPKELLKLSKAETLKRLGIKEVEIGDGKVRYDVDNTLAKEYAGEPGAKSERDIMRNIEGIRKNYMEEVVRGMTYQAAMENLDVISQKLGVTTEVLANQISSGKARLASSALESLDINKQLEFLDKIESKEFADIYSKSMREQEDGAKAFEHAMITHFANQPIEGVKKSVINKIASDFNKQFQYTTIKPARAIEATLKTIAFPNSLKSIEAKFGIDSINTIDLFNNDVSLKEGQAVFTMESGVIEKLTRKYGVGAFESLLQLATHTGSGYGTFDSVKDPVTGKVIQTAKSRAEIDGAIGTGSNRFAIYETAADARAAAQEVYARLESQGVKLKNYEGSSAARSNEVGNKKKVLEKLTKQDGTWDLNIREDFFKIGEENKAVLKDVANIIKDLYKNGDITSRQVRQFIEAQGGPMEGLIKKSASLAILPELSRTAIEEVHGKDWVLEHTTPAQYIKSRMYEYILSKGQKRYKNAFDLALADYHTTLIPKNLDTMVNRILKTDLPADHLPGMDPIESRYYRAYHQSPFDLALINYKNGRVYSKNNLSIAEASQRGKLLRENYSKLIPKNQRLASKGLEASELLNKLEIIKKAMANGRRRNAKRKGMSTWDFDDTLARTKSDVLFTGPDGSTGRLNATEFAKRGAELLEQGYKFDFSEFNKVTGGKPGPFLEKALERAKKFGTKDQFILTARAPEAAPAIKKFLDAQGLEIPLENIVGLGNSTAAAKAMWMLEKFSEGYNDMYFADDAIKNVEAVRDVLNQLDVKSEVQQARRLASQDMNLEFNQMIERKTGIGYEKIFSGAKGKMLGRRRYTQSVVVPGAQDFMGLMQNFLGRGKQGNADRAFFEKNLVDPYARATKEMNEARQRSSEDLKALYKDIPSVKRKLNKRLPGSAFTYDQAIRAYLWQKNGFNIPELSIRDLKSMTDVVSKDTELRNFAEQLNMIGKGTWVKPSANWIGETIVSDLFNLNNKARRAEYLQEWQENIDIIFSPTNLNKIEATQGSKFREALEDSIYRMKTGSNRPTGANRLTNQFNNWINGSVGATMFLNMRSAMLQTISATNYINWSFNNPIKAARAFGNQKQYWKDFTMLWNSAMLKQRRAGLEYNVQEAELAAAMAGQKNKAKAAVAWLIKKGFTPTQVADSFAICGGGATYYRNKIKELMKQGMSKAEAQEKAFLDFQELTETNQQSSRADLISQQQASGLGRTILAWSNTPMQYMRIQEKAARDIINGRGDLKANMSKIAYYGVIQSVIFASLQNALFGWGLDEEEDLDDEGLNKAIDRTVNTVIDSQLRGLGVIGAATSAIRNTVLEFERQEAKAYDDNYLSSPDHSRTVLQLTSFSPVISSKLRKLYSAGNEWNYNRAAIQEMGLDINNPAIHAGANVIEATTNLPVARLVQKVDNILEATDDSNQTWQRVALLMGYPGWSLGIEDTEVEEAKQRGKEKIKEIQKEKRQAANETLEQENIADQQAKRDKGAKEVQCAAITRSGKRCSNMALPGQNFCTIHQKVPQQLKLVRCSHIKSDGKRCKMETKNKSGKCYYHD
jgi:hypothetical protein